MGAFDAFLQPASLDKGSDVSPLAWAALLESLPQAAWVVEAPACTLVAANRRAHEWLGREAGSLIGQPAQSLLPTPEDHVYWMEVAAGDAGELDSETTITGDDGRVRHVARSVRPLPMPGHPARFYTVMLTDLTACHDAQAQLGQAVTELQATLESTADGILVTDLNGRIRAFNRRFAEIWDLPPELLRNRDDNAVHEWLQRCVTDGEAYALRLRDLVNATQATATDTLTLRSQQVIERVTRPLVMRGRAVGRVYGFRDLSERVAAHRRIAELSRTDALTGLPNRVELTGAVERAVASRARDESCFALLLVDLDRFSHVNESLGSSLADLVLVDITRRLRACVRQGDVIARVGGDQFALLVHQADAVAAEAAARRILEAVGQSMSFDDMQFTLTCSIGIAVSPAHGTTLDELMGKAEEAMRSAKQAGRATWRLHNTRRETDQRTLMRMEQAMRQALVHRQFRLHYQPQVDVVTGETVGAEALLRWRDAEFGGEVSPARFIPVAEESGLIIPLGEWVMTEAVRQAAAWLAQGTPMAVAVNVSALQFHQPGFVEQVGRVLTAHALPPQWLELELTESILVHDIEDTLARLRELAELGVRLSIDDFGTGYSSLAYLKRFPIDQVKIDRSFVSGLPGDDSDAGIVRAIVQMAQALNIGVIAEGVETPQQHEFLRQAGCPRFQGYLASPPLDPERFEAQVLQPMRSPHDRHAPAAGRH